MRFHPSGFFGLRTPLLPHEVLARLSDDLSATPSEAALDEDRARVCARLRTLVLEPEIREALFIASPTFDVALERWLGDPLAAHTSGVPATLYRYVARMAARPMPFGLLAGCSVGTLHGETDLHLADRDHYRRHTRLDMGYLADLCDTLHRDPRVRAALTYRPGTALYRAGGRLHNLEAHDDQAGSVRGYALVEVEPSDYLETLLARAEAGARPHELVGRLLEYDPELPREDAEAFVESVIDCQIIVPDLAPAITGEDPLGGIIARLRAIGDPAAEVLTQVNRALSDLDTRIGQPTQRYKEVADTLKVLSVEPDLSRLFHVDLHKPVRTAALGTGPLRELERAIVLLARLTPRHEDEALRRFRDAFVERYGEQPADPGAVPRRIPLAEALDEESGIGMAYASGGVMEPSPLLAGLDLPQPEAPAVSFGPGDESRLRALSEALRTGKLEWSLSDGDLAQLTPRAAARLPDAFAVYGVLAAASPEALARNDFRILVQAVIGPSGAELLGRFCQGDSELRRRVEAHLRAEEAFHPEAVFAEVIHDPGGRLGDLLGRPVLRDYEIPLLGQSGADREHQIGIRDLQVTVVAGRVVLWSARLGREVHPRLTTAHNFGRESLGLFRFLCSLQRQDSARDFQWSWGPLQGAPFLPRVTRGRTVLSLARWNLSREEQATLASARGVPLFRAVQSLRRRHGLPRWVCISDTMLPVDLDNVLAVDALAQQARRQAGVVLLERFPPPEELVARGDGGRFTHELIVPFVRSDAPVSPVTRRRGSSTIQVRRSFPPGSEWLYVKLYTGTGATDQVLTEVLAPLLGASRAIVERWFFIRYADPEPHLRVRLCGKPERLSTSLLPLLRQAIEPFLGDGRIWRMQLDTYEREIEQYGGTEAIELVETLFEADSEAVLAIVQSLEEDAADRRVKLALLGSHRLLLDLGMDLPARAAVWRMMRAALGAELHADRALEHALAKKYRAERASLEALFRAPARSDEATLSSLAERTRRFVPVVDELNRRMRDGRVTVAWPHLAERLVHLHCNRMLSGEARAQELVLYDWLLRLAESERARKRAH